MVQQKNIIWTYVPKVLSDGRIEWSPKQVYLRLYGTIRKGFTEEFLFDWILNDGQGRKDI